MVIKNCHSAHFLPSALSVKGILREGTWKIAVVEGEKDEEAAGEMTPEDGPSTGQQSGYRLNMGIPPHPPPLPIQTHKAGGLTTSAGSCDLDNVTLATLDINDLFGSLPL